ncbi:MAG: hypothetical protein ACK5AZ_10560 [Bryobacteraceae bacterium]
MTRRYWIAALLMAAGCRREEPRLLLPEAVGGEWTLAESEPVAAEEAPETIRALGLREAARGRYTGPEEIGVTVYRMSTGAGAFEALQKHRPEEGKLAFYEGVYFVIAESPQAGRERLTTFSRAFGRALAKM